MASKPASLFVVATPIGNLADLSPRALATLAEVDVVAAEDTRVTRKLLVRNGIKAKLLSYREETERRLAPRLVERLLAGQSVALVCDAGTPCISDPGYRLVRAAAEAGIAVVSVPGPSAVTALLAVSGLPSDRFSFEGFLPARAGPRKRAIEAMRGRGTTVVLYESPRRIVRMLGELARLLDDPQVAVGRELTKRHEQLLRGSASQLARRIEAQGARGEFVVAVQVEAAAKQQLSGEALATEISRMQAEGLSLRDVARLLKPLGVPRRQVYAAARQR